MSETIFNGVVRVVRFENHVDPSLRHTFYLESPGDDDRYSGEVTLPHEHPAVEKLFEAYYNDDPVPLRLSWADEIVLGSFGMERLPLSSGRTVSVCNSHIETDINTGPLSIDERREVAAIMIGRWVQYALAVMSEDYDDFAAKIRSDSYRVAMAEILRELDTEPR